MERYFGSKECGTKKNRFRSFRMEELEGRMLLAVVSGGEISFDIPAVEASVPLDTAESIPINDDPLPTFELTIAGYGGVYDGNAHGVTLSGLEEGDLVRYSEEGVFYYSTPLTYTDAGNYSVYVTVDRMGYQTWRGSANISINRKQITVTATTVDNKAYDGTTTATVRMGNVNGILEADAERVQLKAAAAFPSSAVGSYSLRVNYSLEGTGKSNYICPGYQIAKASITDGDPTKISVSLVLSDSLPSSVKLNNLPRSLEESGVGDTLYVQVWVKNCDGSLLGCTGGYLDLVYDSSRLTAQSFTVSSNFSKMTGECELKEGRVALVGGMCTPGDTTLGITQWALLGTVAFSVDAAGTAQIATSTPTRNGVESESFNLSRSSVGVIKSSDIDFGSAEISITGHSSQLNAPVFKAAADIKTYVSYGANRHCLQWNAVENAIRYELAWSADGKNWKALTTTETSAIVTGLTYGTLESYRVRAIGAGGYSDSEWSTVKLYYVCPMDINNDGSVASMDRTLMGRCWLSEEGEENFIRACDIDGDSEINGLDRIYLTRNWLSSIEEGDEMRYPAPLSEVNRADLFESFADMEWDSYLG